MNLVVSVIIPTFNDWERLRICLDALVNQSYPSKFLDVIVVNNDLEKQVPLDFKMPANFLLLNEERPGSYAARNAGLRVCKGEIIAFTDSDCIPDPDWVRNAVSFFETHKGITRIGGAIKIFFQEDRPSKAELYDKVFAFPQEAYVKSGNAVTANMFAYKYLFDEIGYFNAELRSGGDYQWGKLADGKEFPIAFAANVIVLHPARPSIKDLVAKAKRVGKGQGEFKTKEKESFKNIVLNTIRIFQPRFWEIRRIWKNGGDLGLGNKLFLVVLRHYILWISGLEELKNRRRFKDSTRELY